MFDKERFHNALVLPLGYERIVKDKRIIIDVDDYDDPWVTLTFHGCHEVVRFKASNEVDAVKTCVAPDTHNEIDFIFDAVHYANVEANKQFSQTILSHCII